jgi:hypothetical protein
MLGICSQDTVLIGHSLHKDLRALHVNHANVRLSVHVLLYALYALLSFYLLPSTSYLTHPRPHSPSPSTPHTHTFLRLSSHISFSTSLYPIPIIIITPFLISFVISNTLDRLRGLSILFCSTPSPSQKKKIFLLFVRHS